MGHGIEPDLSFLSAATARSVAETMHALSAPSRVRILSRLAAGPCSVGELARHVVMEQSAVSQQLRVLRHLGLVVGERDGRQVIYALHDEHVHALLEEAVSHTEHLRLGLSASPAADALPGMSGTTPALFAAAAGVGFGHAILPDHWVPLAVLGRARRYPLAKIARLSGLAGVAHVLLSIVLGAVIIAVGLQFRSAVSSAQDTIIGCVLIATGLGFGALQATGHGHHHDHDHHDHTGHAHDDDRHPADPDARHGLARMASIMVPFGAAASPDLTILPVFLAATTVGVATAVGSVVIFGAVTIGTIVALTLGAAKGGYQIQGEWLDRWGNAVTAVVLVVIGALVLTGAI